VLASASVEVSPELDVAACIFASRGAEERYFVWEQPDRDGFALGTLGVEWTVEGIADPERFSAAAAACADATRDATRAVRGSGPPASGPVWVGGFSFDTAGGEAPHWASLPPTLLVLPSVSLVRYKDEVVATVNVACRADSDPEILAGSAAARLETLRADPIPLVDPDPRERFEIVSVRPPEHYVEAVAEARELIRCGKLEKVVLAREVRVEARSPFRLAVVFDELRQAFPSCFCFCVGTPEGGFVGASPELLVRREGGGVASVALAGSTRRSADPAVDDHLGQRLLQSPKDRSEHEIVARRIERALAPLSVWVAANAEPELIRVANIQHLATPVRAQLAEPLSAVELAGVLHPTPGVGGEPWEVACEVMALEQMDRGWYAGPVGWMDAAEDGEFCVALRCALVNGTVGHCYAGVGVVADSDPEAELAESEVKLQALLTVLAGP
jgi:salicylate biosynthesis isochorismate synthase/menaquinone-specific isochorismate synthase